MATQARIATWNVQNLFAAGAESGPKSAAEFDAKVRSLASTITAMNPDVLGLQEIGDREALDAVLAKVGGTWHVELAEPDARGIGVAIASRTALADVAQVASFPEGLAPVQTGDGDARTDSMGRAALAASVDTAAGTIRVIVCHLKSKLLTFPGGRFSPRDEHERARFAAYALFRRTAEAATVRDAATSALETGEASPLVVLGDLNDEVDAQTSQILLGPPGSEIGTSGYSQPDSGDALRLWNLAPRIPEEQRYSRIYRGRRELIDHILVSHGIVDRIADGAVTTDFGGPTPSIDDDPNRRRDAPGSDHRPVLAVVDA